MKKKIKGNIYYLNYRFIDEDLNVEYYTTDSQKRRVPWTKKDLEENGFFCGMGRAVRLSAIKHYIFVPCPWKDTYKDQSLRIYFNDENYNKDLEILKNPKNRFADLFDYDTIFFGWDCFDLPKALKSVNEELANEMALYIELNKNERKY